MSRFGQVWFVPLALLGSCLAVLPAKAADHSVSGQVVDALSGMPVTDATVTFFGMNGDRVVRQATTNAGGQYSVDVPDGNYKVLAAGRVNSITIEATRYHGVTGMDSVLNLQLINRHAPGGEFARMIFGLDQSAVTSGDATLKYFFDLSVSVPLAFHQESDPMFGPRYRAWGNVRTATAPQQITSTVTNFNLASSVASLKVNELVQTFEFRGGLDARLPLGLDSFHLSFDKNTIQRFSASLILGAGGGVPLSSRNTLNIFKVSPQAEKLYPQALGKQYIGFTPADRDRFYRQLFGGLRLKTHYFDKDTEEPLDRFPAAFDLTYGTDEAVTGGTAHGGVLRIEGFYPAPSTWGSNFYIFFTTLMRPVRNRTTDPLLLEPAPSSIGLPDVISNGALATLPAINRDHYRIGIGLDIIRLFQIIQNHGHEPGQTTK